MEGRSGSLTGTASGLANAGIVLFGVLGSKLHFHGGGVRVIDQNIIGHFAGCVAKVVIADGKRRNPAAGANALFSGNDRHFCRQADVFDNPRIGSDRIIRRQIDYVAFRSRRLCDGLNVVGIGKSVVLAGVAQLGECFLDHFVLIF